MGTLNRRSSDRRHFYCAVKADTAETKGQSVAGAAAGGTNGAYNLAAK